MGLYRLRVDDGKLESGIMERVISENIDFEKDFENWLENSPSVLFDDDESTVLWIGRQATATVGDINKYPDLLGIDAIVSTTLLESTTRAAIKIFIILWRKASIAFIIPRRMANGTLKGRESSKLIC